MKRREFITLLGSAAATWPMVARAQQAERMRRIGVLMDFAENNSRAHAHMAAFRDGLQKLGWTEDRNIRIDTRWAAFDAESRNGSRRNSSHCGLIGAILTALIGAIKNKAAA